MRESSAPGDRKDSGGVLSPRSVNDIVTAIYIAESDVHHAFGHAKIGRHVQLIGFSQEIITMRVKDVAEKIGVSSVTVSRVLNGSPLVAQKTRERVLRALNELNFHPSAVAQSLARQSVKTLGYAIVTSKRFRSPNEVLTVDPWMSQVLQGAIQTSAASEYNVLVEIVESSYQLSRVLRAGQIAACLLRVSRYDNELLQEIQAALNDCEIPVIILDFYRFHDSLVYLNGEKTEGAQLAVDHLIRTGHRSIAHIAGHPHSFSSEQLMNGYFKALDSAGIAPSGRIVETGFFTEASGMTAMRRILSHSPHPTAVFCANDRTAIGALRVAISSGLRVPDDIAIIGFDDIEVAPYLTPPLTTVRYPYFEMGHQAADLAIAAIEAKHAQRLNRQCDLSQPELIVRGSA